MKVSLTSEIRNSQVHQYTKIKQAKRMLDFPSGNDLRAALWENVGNSGFDQPIRRHTQASNANWRCIADGRRCRSRSSQRR
jgi:hypothetical protein